jgi:hypothetical protein
MVIVCSLPALSSLNSTNVSTECFKRWNDVLDPAIDRSPWTRDEDRILLLAIGEYGRAWKMIVDTYFPGRTGLDAKNRYVFSDLLEKDLKLMRSRHRQLTRKRKRETKPVVKTTTKAIKKEQPQQQFPSVQSPLPQLTPTSLSPSLSAVGTPGIIIPHHQHINLSPRNPEMHLHLHDQLLGGDDAATERSLSVPPGSSSSYWEAPLDGLFSPPLPVATPETPYSSCSSLSTSHYEGSLSSFKTEPHQQQYESGELLMHGVPGKFTLGLYTREIDG